MRAFVDATWRAATLWLHWKVLLWSLLPLSVAGGMVFGLGWFYWEPSIAGVRATLEQWELLATLFEWLDSIGAGGMRAVLAPLILVSLAVPAIIGVTLLLVSWLMAPALVRLVAARRFPQLERRSAAPGWWGSLAWTLPCALAALLALVLSIPLWFVPPLVLVLPPLVWGWLAYRILAFDALALHADAAERRQVLHSHRWSLRLSGLLCGYAAALPSAVWAVSAVGLIFAPWLMVAAVWLYTAVFAYTTLWYAHFALAALHRLRGGSSRPGPPEVTAPALGAAGTIGDAHHVLTGPGPST